MDPCGVFVLLLMVVGGVVLLYLLPRHISRRILLVVAMIAVAFALLLLFRWSFGGRQPALARLFFLVLFGALGYLFIRLLIRLFQSTPPAERLAPPAADRLKKAVRAGRRHWRDFWRDADVEEACPSVGRLKDLLAERLPAGEQARLAAHLEVCAACQHRVEGLTAGQESWVGMARNLGRQPPAAPALRRVIDNLKGADQPEATSDVPVFAGDLPLGFLSPPEKPGQLGRLERYEVLEEVGRGGMGVVLKAFDPSLHRVVAIKVLAPQLATSGVARKRFLREAKAAAAVTHDHIVTIHAVDEANGLPYLVMQYVPGLSLQDRIDKDGPLSDLTEILRIGVQTASGLAAAHGHGIVHRDVKPANILLEEGVQRVKITDFGLARAMDDASLTQSGLVAGSPLYMAPEQARGESLDHRADLFSLGSVLYTACTGRPPFRAANTLAVLRRVAEDDPRPIRETNPEVPDWLAEVVAKLMAKEPADRYQSANEVVEVLGHHLAEVQHGTPLPRSLASPVPTKEDGAGASAAGLPTSVTICPSCGAGLHVPDRMLGGTVHCGECGSPFRAEDGSEEILVARAAPTPFGRRRWWSSLICSKLKSGSKAPSPFGRRRWLNRKLVTRALYVVAGLVFVLVLVAFSSDRDTPHRMATVSSDPQMQSVGPETTPFWKYNTLAVFPAEATLFGAIDFRPFGSLNLGDEWTQAALRLALSPEDVSMLIPENLGRIRIDGASLAYYEGLKPEDARGFVQLEGLALDGRKRALDFIRRSASGKVRIDDEERKGLLTDTPVRVSGPELLFAIGLYDDHRVFLARSMGRSGKEAEHLKALEFLRWFDRSNTPRPVGDLLSGYNPPWVQMALKEIPSNARGLLLGEIPAGWRKLLTETLGLRACPRTFVFHLRRDGDGVVLSLNLNLDKAGAELTLKEDLDKWRDKGLDVLKSRFPGLRKEPLALLGQTLKSLRWETTPGSGRVRGRLQISSSTGRALRTLIVGAFQPLEEGPPER